MKYLSNLSFLILFTVISFLFSFAQPVFAGCPSFKGVTVPGAHELYAKIQGEGRCYTGTGVCYSNSSSNPLVYKCLNATLDQNYSGSHTEDPTISSSQYYISNCITEACVSGKLILKTTAKKFKCKMEKPFDERLVAVDVQKGVWKPAGGFGNSTFECVPR